MKIDLAEDFAVTLKCGCVVTFVGARGHRQTGFRAGCKIKGTTPTEEPDAKKRLDNYDQHAKACLAIAKRLRGTAMEKIDPTDPTEEPPA